MTRLAPLLLLVVGACSDLPPLGDTTCGNGVVDPGEDCDGPAPACIACRVTCDVTADACATLVPAPHDGSLYRCGADDRCHAPSGQLDKSMIASAPFPVLGFGVTDVDGDHVGDVVGLSPSSLVTRFGSVSGAPLERELESLTPKLTGAPAISHLDDDASLDFVLPSADGLVAYTAKNLVLAPKSFAIKYTAMTDPAGTLIVPRAAFPVDNTHLGLIFWQTTVTPPTATLVGGVVDVGLAGHMPQLFPLCAADYDGTERNPDRFTPDKLDTYARPPGKGVVIALLGHHLQGALGSEELCALQIVPAMSSGGDATITQLAAFDAGGATHVALANLTQTPDACPAAVTSTAAAAQAPRTLRAYAGSTGATCGLATTPTTTAPFLLPDRTGAIGHVPVTLPAGDDVALDALVTEAGYVFAFHDASPAAPTLIPLYASDRNVDEVSYGDVDADGRPDLVLASSTEPNLDILYGDDPDPATNRPTFRRVRKGTNGAPHHVVVGDFDGDGADDVVYFESESPTADRMELVYGGHDGASAPVEAGQFAQVVAAVPVQLADTNDPLLRVRDLAVGEQRPGEAAPVVDLLHGATERAMIPYIDPRASGEGAALFTTPAIGRFLLPTGNVVGFRSPDLASIAVDPLTGDAALWVLKGASEGSFEAAFSTEMTGDISHELSTNGTWGFCSLAALSKDFCLDNAGALPWTIGDHDRYLGIDTVQGNIVTQDLRAAFAPVYSKHVFTPGRVGNAFPAPLGGATKLVVFGDAGGSACTIGDDGAATCVKLEDQPGASCIDGALGRIDASDAAPALIALCDNRIVRFTDIGVATTLVELGFGALTPVSIAIGDVTGDGVDDLVLGNGAAIVVLRQQTTTEAP